MLEIIQKDIDEIWPNLDLNSLQDKTILISGASGLLGTYFLASLKKLQENHRSGLKTYALVKSEPTDYFQKLCSFEGAQIIQGDLTDQNFQRNLPHADFIIHAAGYGQPHRFMEFPITTLHLNTAVTFAFFERLKAGGKFLFIGTSEVYVGLERSPHQESQIGHTNTDHPRACYIEAKRCGEAICHSFKKSGIDAKIARLALAYGPGTRLGDRRVLHSFIEKGLQGEIRLLDQGQAWRTYCYVTDAIEVLWKIFLEGQQTVYNVGGVSRTSIRDLAITIGHLMRVPVVFPKEIHKLAGAPEDVQLDLSRIQKEFSKKDFIKLEEGLRRTIEWEKSLYEKAAGKEVLSYVR
jgi:nucleoside-diphosphate-sugar epimerase